MYKLKSNCIIYKKGEKKIQMGFKMLSRDQHRGSGEANEV